MGQAPGHAPGTEGHPGGDVPQPGLPDLVFTANAGLVHRDKFFSSRFKHEVRARETPHFDAWFAAHGFEVITLPEGMYFEGAGDALFCGHVLVAGYRTRSDVKSHQWIAGRLNIQMVALELVDPRFYHLDTCFCPLDTSTALYFPPAFDAYGRRVLESQVKNLIPVAESDALRFGCNAVVVGKDVVHPPGCEEMARQLGERGFGSHPVDLSEFLKSGGSAKCLTLRVDGEEAAGW